MKLSLAVMVVILGTTALSAGPIGWVPDHVVVVVEENHNLTDIIGNSDAPYMNSLAANNALFTQSYNPFNQHPSLPNYLELFSGSPQGKDDDFPLRLSSPYPANLGASLISAGYSFTGYSEGLPSVGFTGNSSGLYVRKHAPWVPWQAADDNNLAPNQLKSTVNQPFTAFPTDYSTLPTVSFVIPNLCDDAHDPCGVSAISTMDTWLQSNISPYAAWAQTHNSLLIVTTDESAPGENPFYTVFAGQDVIQGQYSETITHDNVLATVESLYGLTPIANSANAFVITDAFDATVPEPGTLSLFAAAFGAFGGWRRLRRGRQAHKTV